jgi:hypothetical protein
MRNWPLQVREGHDVTTCRRSNATDGRNRGVPQPPRQTSWRAPDRCPPNRGAQAWTPTGSADEMRLRRRTHDQPDACAFHGMPRNGQKLESCEGGPPLLNSKGGRGTAPTSVRTERRRRKENCLQNPCLIFEKCDILSRVGRVPLEPRGSFLRIGTPASRFHPVFSPKGPAPSCRYGAYGTMQFFAPRRAEGAGVADSDLPAA